MFERHPKTSRSTIMLIVLVASDLLPGALFLAEERDAYRVPDAVFHHDRVPGLEISWQWGNRRVRFATNSLGIKDKTPREIVLDATEDRVLFLGDFFAEGRTVADIKGLFALIVF